MMNLSPNEDGQGQIRGADGLAEDCQRSLHLVTPPPSAATAMRASSEGYGKGSATNPADVSRSTVRNGDSHGQDDGVVAFSLLLPDEQDALNPATPESQYLLAPPALIGPPSAASFHSAASDAWISPEEAEGDYVRKTYMHFDRVGVKGDGVVEGKEWTRHRAVDGETPWDAHPESDHTSTPAGSKGDTGRQPKRNVLNQHSLRCPVNGSARQLSSDAATPATPSKGNRNHRNSLQNVRRVTSNGTKSSPLAAPPTAAGGSSHPAEQKAPILPSSLRSNWRSSPRKSEGFSHSQALAKLTAATTQEEGLEPPEAHGGTPVPTMSAASSSTSLASTSLNNPPGSRSISSHLHPPSSNTDGTSKSRSYRMFSSSSNLSPNASPNGRERRMSESEMSELTELDSIDWGIQREAERRKRYTLSSRQFGGLEEVNNDEEEDEEEVDSWQRLDRYGFFSRDWSGQHGRICILPATTFSLVPTLGASRFRANKAMAISKAARAIVQATEAASANSNRGSPHLSQGVTPVTSPYIGHSNSGSRSGGTHNGGEETPISSAEGESVEQHPKADAISALRSRCQNVQREKEQRRIDKWSQMLVPGEKRGNNVAFYSMRDDLKGSVKLERRVFKGIPDRWRAAAWWALVEMTTSLEQQGKQGDADVAQFSAEKSAAAAATVPQAGRGLIRRLSTARRPRKSRLSGGVQATSAGSDSPSQNEVKTRRSRRLSEPLEVAAARRRRHDHIRRFSRLLAVPSPHDVQIDLDVPRTISNHVHFHTRYGHGQRSLFKVLHCFSLLCPQCGYCQGMGSLAATLLNYYPDEQAYALLVALHDSPKYALHDLFSPGFPGLLENFEVQEALAGKLLPELSEAMSREGVVASAYATRWYITLFSSVVPFETQLRLWDAFLLKGMDVLVIFSLAILHSLSLTVLREGDDSTPALSPLPYQMEAARDGNGASQPRSRSGHTTNPLPGSTIPPASASPSAGGGGGDPSSSSSSDPHHLHHHQQHHQQHQHHHQQREIDFELILSTLNHVFVPEDDEALFRWVHRLALDSKVGRILKEGRGGGKR